MIILLAELILLILFFVYMDKVSLMRGEGAYGQWGGDRASQRRSLTRRTSDEGRRENGTRGARRGPNERFGGGSVGKAFWGGMGGLLPV